MEERLSFAEVAVDAPVTRQTFSYSVPKGLKVTPGQLVWVPFGARVLQGIVFQLVRLPSVEPTRDIAGTIDTVAVLSSTQLNLAYWLSRYYLCPLFVAASMMMPPGFKQRVLTYFTLAPHSGSPPKPLTKLHDLVLRHLGRHGRVELRQLEGFLKRKGIATAASQLVRRGLLLKADEFGKPRVSPKTNEYLHLTVPLTELEGRLTSLPEWGKSSKQADLLEYLAETQRAARSDQGIPRSFGSSTVGSLVAKGFLGLRGQGNGVELRVSSSEALNVASTMRRTRKSERVIMMLGSLEEAGTRLALTEVSKGTGASRSDIEILSKAGLVAIEKEEVLRDPLAHRTFPLSAVPELTVAQEGIWREIENGLVQGRKEDESGRLPRVFLLHGVTGSGKTEIYLRSLAKVVQMGQRAIVMVPEIALTPQTVGRFLARFPGRVAILHSRLSPGEQYDEWRRIRSGEFDVVIGSRSAIFAPVPDLGLIVLDEEHEWTYKQADVDPRYHAREVAIKLAELSGASVILGSATPDVASYYRAQRGEFRLVELRERVVSSGWAGDPVPGSLGRLSAVEVVDLRQELRAGNRSIFSRSLINAMTVALAAREQAILFLNRRGTATFVMCRDCGTVLKCKRCDVTLTYHSAEDDLVCHLCNNRASAPDVCPSCFSSRIRYLGVGTQKVEEEARKLFPEARLLRWDRDTARRQGAHEEILERFTSHDADILIGTQMIAKGLDLPRVTLVGVVCADIGLNLPDFRSCERTFQLLTQVAGRAGRGIWAGKTIIQTYSPDHYAIMAASQQDYGAFYRRESAFRRDHENPPYGKLAKLVYTGTNSERCQKEAQRVSRLLKEVIYGEGMKEISLIGPAPAYIGRVRGRFRWQLIVRGHDVQRLVASVSLPRGWLVDVDPVSLL